MGLSIQVCLCLFNLNQVTQGFKPVLDAKVTATVTDPNSGQWVLKLKDEGAGQYQYIKNKVMPN